MTNIEKRKSISEDIMPVAKDVAFDMNCHNTKLNNNCIVFGNPGSGKTRCIVEPQLVTANSSFVVGDPKGLLYQIHRQQLESRGYTCHYIDFTRPEISDGYSFYSGLDINNQNKIMELADVLYAQLNDTSRNSQFWRNTSVSLISACIFIQLELHEYIKHNHQMITAPVECTAEISRIPNIDIARYVFNSIDTVYEQNLRGLVDLLTDIRDYASDKNISDAIDFSEATERLKSFFAHVFDKANQKPKYVTIHNTFYGINKSFQNAEIISDVQSFISFASYLAECLNLLAEIDNSFLIDYNNLIYEISHIIKEALKQRKVSLISVYMLLNLDTLGTRNLRKVLVASESETTFGNIVVSAIAPLVQMDTNEINAVFDKGNQTPFDFTEIGKKKVAVFFVASDTNRSLDALLSIFYSQCINSLVEFADKECNGSLPRHTRLLIDDFCTNIRLTQMTKALASFRSRNISAMLIVQTLGQLQQMYDRDADTIVGCCDTILYLGGNSLVTAEDISRRANVPIQDILNLELEKMYCFRRDEKPRLCNKINYDTYVKPKLMAQEKGFYRSVSFDNAINI